MKPCNLVNSELQQDPLKDLQIRDHFNPQLWVLLQVWNYTPTQINRNLGIANSKLSRFVYDELPIKGYEQELFKDLLRQTLAQAEKRLDSLTDFYKDIMLAKIKATKIVLED